MSAFTGISALLLLATTGLVVTGAGAAACRASQQGAAGTVVDHYLFDPILRRSWAVVVDCRHPERPPTLMPVKGRPSAPHRVSGRDVAGRGGVPGNSSAKVWLRAGSPVRIWKNGAVRVQLSGTAVESAPMGAEVTVRGGGGGALLRGIVRGADSVELLPAVAGWREP